MTLFVVALSSLLVGGLLAKVACALGWFGRGWSNAAPLGEEETSRHGERESSGRSGIHIQRVPPVGGLALLLVLGGAEWWGLDTGNLPWVSLLGAWLLGTWDDFSPLGPRCKLLGQLGVGFLLAGHTGSLGAGDPSALAMDLVLALVAMNLANTWDHADGLCAGWVLLLPGTPVVIRGALAGFLPLNLVRMGSPKGASASKPRVRAYLGDAGSHVLGILVAVQPGAWLALALPGLDLLRVIWLRRAAGQPFWAGDRRHLGHVLEARGLPPVLALVVLWPLWLLGEGPLVWGALFASFGLLLWLCPAAGCTRGTRRG